MEEKGKQETYQCPNCTTILDDNVAYCSHCGQQRKNLKPTIWEFIGEFLNSVFNLDNKFFGTAIHLFIPAKLSRAFFQGKRTRFHHPLRIYFLSILFLFFILSIFKIDDVIKFDNNGINTDRYLAQEEAQKLNQQLEDYKIANEGSNGLYHIDSLRNELFIISGGDSISLNDTLDSGKWNMVLLGEKFNITLKEIALNSTEELIEKYNPKEWYNKIILKQFIRIVKDPNSLNTFLFTNLSWLFLAVVPIFAIMLKLIYIRRKKYFIEHLVFLLHLFSALIIFTSIMIMIIVPTEINELAIAIFVMAVFFPLIAFKRFYEQSWIKTIFKFLLIGFMFAFTFIICLLFFLAITALLY